MSAERPSRLRFELWFAYLLPLPPVAAGFVWTILLGGLSLLIWDEVRFPLVLPQEDGSSEVSPYGILLTITSLMWGMLLATGRATSASEVWDLTDEVAPIESRDRWKRERELLRDEVVHPRRLMIAMLIGAVVSALILRWIFGVGERHWAHPCIWLLAAMLGGLFLMLARGVALTREIRVKHAPILAAAEKVDLLDLEPQLRAGRCALRTAISWVVGASLTSLFLLLGPTELTIGLLLGITVVALASVLPPILKIQRIIRAAKAAEIERLQSEVREARAEVLESTQDGPDAAPGRLADLLAYLHYVETLPELPFDKAKLAVTSLYFAVPLISWLWISLVQSWLEMIA